MPLLIGRRPADEARRRAEELLAEVGLAERAHHRPGALSGGEQQRVAVARALAGSPRALLADEPTGDLDRATGERLHETLRGLVRARGLTVVVVTHNEELARALRPGPAARGRAAPTRLISRGFRPGPPLWDLGYDWSLPGAVTVPGVVLPGVERECSSATPRGRGG